MLRVLRIRNFAIIESLELEFHSGLNAITGETGAGKSIILDAISLILGNRANSDLIRSGEDEATVEALFDVARNDLICDKLKSQGIDLSKSDHEIVIKRTIQRSGKSKIFLNGDLITLTQLATICENLVDLCSQHEHQSLVKPTFQLDLIDRFGGLLDLRQKLREYYSSLRSAENELATLTSGDSKRERTIEFLRFQINEIEEFQPQPGEEETLLAERKRLLNATMLAESVNSAVELLTGGENGDGVGARTLLGKAIQRLIKASAIDEGLRSALEAAERTHVELDETLNQLSSYASELEFDDHRLSEVEKRLTRLNELKRKYGSSIEEILKTRSALANELDGFEHRQENIERVESRLKSIREEYFRAAEVLSRKRKNVARTLKETIEAELGELMMPDTSFEVDFSTISDPLADGIDRVQFLLSPNLGEEPKPMAKVASGGELSRVLLAIRRTIADQGGIGVYLFDEIDSGIGGITASVVGKKLRTVAKHNQVICITHLPQVAAFADAHYLVSKGTANGRTSSAITALKPAARVDELARMLGGLNVNEKSRANARDLLKQATSAL